MHPKFVDNYSCRKGHRTQAFGKGKPYYLISMWLLVKGTKLENPHKEVNLETSRGYLMAEQTITLPGKGARQQLKTALTQATHFLLWFIRNSSVDFRAKQEAFAQGEVGVLDELLETATGKQSPQGRFIEGFPFPKRFRGAHQWILSPAAELSVTAPNFTDRKFLQQPLLLQQV